MLEKKVTHVLRMKHVQIHKRTPCIKSRLRPIMILVCAVLIIAGSCATRQKAISEMDFLNAYSGTWFNPERSGIGFDFQKLVVHADGSWDVYANNIIKERISHGDLTLIDSWKDADGVIWYRLSKYTIERDPIFEYGRISDSGETLEFIFVAGTETIKKWEPDNPHYNYRTYYRQ